MRFVFKFGGSSLSNVNKIKKVASYIKQIKTREDIELIIVVSAMGKTTNKLINLAEKLYKNPYSKEFSSLISVGENISASALALALEEQEVNSISLTAKDIKIHTKGSATNSIITYIDKEKIESLLSNNNVVIVTGFQGVDKNNQTTTLGRGGSDTTATALAATFNAQVKIFTDVPGFFSCNPHIYSNAKHLKSLNINSALELASNGAKILDNRCLEIVNKHKLNLEVCESLSDNGTIIYNQTNHQLENFKVDGVSHKSRLLFVKYSYKNNDFLQILKQNSNSKINFLNQNKSKNIITQYFVSNIQQKTFLALVPPKYHSKISTQQCESVVLSGSGLSFYPEFIKKVQNILKINHIYYLLLNLTPTTLTIIVKNNKAKKLVYLLAKEFNLLSTEN